MEMEIVRVRVRGLCKEREGKERKGKESLRIYLFFGF